MNTVIFFWLKFFHWSELLKLHILCKIGSDVYFKLISTDFPLEMLCLLSYKVFRYSFISGEYSYIVFALVTYAYKGSSYLNSLFFNVFHWDSSLSHFSYHSSRQGWYKASLTRLLRAGIPESELNLVLIFSKPSK